MLRCASISSRAALALSLIFAAAPAMASAVCEDLWFARNAAFDAEGYCFRSPLGQATFDNSDCSSSVPRVAADMRDFVTRVQDREAALSCAVNTNRRTIDLPMLERRQALSKQPLATATESLCIGYIGPSLDLRAAPDVNAAVIGSIQPGDSVLIAHDGIRGWNFASEVKRVGEDQTSLGWHSGELELCEARAG